MINLDMKMPKNCNECPFHGLFYCTLYKAIKGEQLDVSYELEEKIRSHKCLLIDEKVGHWIYNNKYSDRYDITYNCSCCEREINVPYEARNEVYKDYPYCHCGARMESEDKE